MTALWILFLRITQGLPEALVEPATPLLTYLNILDSVGGGFLHKVKNPLIAAQKLIKLGL